MAATDSRLVLLFVGGEIGVYLAYKIARNDFLYSLRFAGVLAAVVSFVERVIVKVVVDFSGCVHFRHPFEMGGFAWSLSMVWAQLMPFVALELYEGENKEELRLLLGAGVGGWGMLNVAFFYSINAKYVHTFFATVTATAFNCDLFLNSREDSAKFRAAFKNRRSYIRGCEAEVKLWVRENFKLWLAVQPAWFKEEMIPEDFTDGMEEWGVGGMGGGKDGRSRKSKKRRTSISFVEVSERSERAFVTEKCETPCDRTNNTYSFDSLVLLGAVCEWESLMIGLSI